MENIIFKTFIVSVLALVFFLIAKSPLYISVISALILMGLWDIERLLEKILDR